MKRLMKDRRVVLGAIAALVVLLAGLGVVLAQDYNLEPRYGSTTLVTGFQPDPHNVSLTAGGPINTPHCSGNSYVADNPDYRLNYTAGTQYPLNIYVRSSVDTTLLINLPNGQWLCNDDGGQGNNPLISYPAGQAPSGRFDIYVGTYNTENATATLVISEIAPRW